MNRWVRFALAEFVRVGVPLALGVACLFITVPFMLQVTLGVRAGPAAWALLLVHLALITAWIVHTLVFQAHHAGAALKKGRPKAVLTPPHLPWRWLIGYAMAMILCLVGEWWWVRTLQETRAASARVTGTDHRVWIGWPA